MAHESSEAMRSLQQLEPLPIETPQEDQPEPTLPSEADLEKQRHPTHASTTSSLGLHGSNHSSIYYLTRIQRYSSYAFTAFTTLHIANTSLIPLITASVPASEPYLLQTRELYQTPLTEPLVIALPIIAHVGSGLALRWIRRRQNLQRYGNLGHERSGGSGSSSLREWWQAQTASMPHLSIISASGYAFTAALSAHIFTNRILPLLVEGDSSNINLSYVSHGFARHPVTAYAAYVALLGVGVGHMVWGWAKWLGWAQGAVAPRWAGGQGVREVDQKKLKRRKRAWWGINGVTAFTAVVWAAGGLGVIGRGGLKRGWVGEIYDNLYTTVGL